MPPSTLKAIEFRILQRIFTAEIENRLPAQLQSKYLPGLQKRGFVQPMTRNFGRDALGVIEVSGWALTELGRMTYCQACTEVED